MLSDMPASRAICLGPLMVWTFSKISGGNSECISCGTLSSLIFHRILRFLTLPVLSIFSSCCQAVRCGLPPSVGQSAPRSRAQPAEIAIKMFRFRIGFLEGQPLLVCFDFAGVNSGNLFQIVKGFEIALFFALLHDRGSLLGGDSQGVLQILGSRLVHIDL